MGRREERERQLALYEVPACAAAIAEAHVIAALEWPLPKPVREHLQRALSDLGECKRALAGWTGYPYARRE